MSDGLQREPDLVDPRLSAPRSYAGMLPEVRASGVRTTEIGSFRDVKERSASRIALIITWTFTITTGMSVLWIGVIVAVYGRNPVQLKGLFEAIVPAFKDLTLSLTGLFGPLLAFVLGYYFGEKKSDS